LQLEGEEKLAVLYCEEVPDLFDQRLQLDLTLLINVITHPQLNSFVHLVLNVLSLQELRKSIEFVLIFMMLLLLLLRRLVAHQQR
jgi:hypothetical protein